MPPNMREIQWELQRLARTAEDAGEEAIAKEVWQAFDHVVAARRLQSGQRKGGPAS